MKAIELANLILQLPKEQQQLQIGSMFDCEYGNHYQISGIEKRSSNRKTETIKEYMDDETLGDEFIDVN